MYSWLHSISMSHVPDLCLSCSDKAHLFSLLCDLLVLTYWLLHHIIFITPINLKNIFCVAPHIKVCTFELIWYTEYNWVCRELVNYYYCAVNCIYYIYTDLLIVCFLMINVETKHTTTMLVTVNNRSWILDQYKRWTDQGEHVDWSFMPMPAPIMFELMPMHACIYAIIYIDIMF